MATQWKFKKIFSRNTKYYKSLWYNTFRS